MVDLAAQTGLTQGYLSKIENNHKIPTHEVLKKLAEVLNLPYIELMEKAGYIDKDVINSIEKIENNSIKKRIFTNEKLTIGKVIKSNLVKKENPITLEEISYKTGIEEGKLEKIIEGKDVNLKNDEIADLAEALDYPFMYLYLLSEKGNNFFGFQVTEDFLSGLAAGSNEMREVLSGTLKILDTARLEGTKINEKKYEDIKRLYNEALSIQFFDNFYRQKILTPSSEEFFDIKNLLSLDNVSYEGKVLTKLEKELIISMIPEIISGK